MDPLERFARINRGKHERGKRGALAWALFLMGRVAAWRRWTARR